MFSGDTTLFVRLTRAREAQQQLRADEIIRIADDASNDWMEVETKSGRMLRVFDHEHAKRSEIRIKTRQGLIVAVCAAGIWGTAAA